MFGLHPGVHAMVHGGWQWQRILVRVQSREVVMRAHVSYHSGRHTLSVRILVVRLHRTRRSSHFWLLDASTTSIILRLLINLELSCTSANIPLSDIDQNR